MNLLLISQKWYIDVPEFNLRGEKIHLSPILDEYNGKIISHNIYKLSNLGQINNIFNKGFEGKNLEGLIFYSDQGRQYQHRLYQQRLKKHEIIQSMSKKAIIRIT